MENDKEQGTDKLVLIGAGGHCQSVIDSAIGSGKFTDIVITDKDEAIGTSIMGCDIIGTDDVLPGLKAKGIEQVFISVGSIRNTKVRRAIKDMCMQEGFKFPSIFDSSSVISGTASVGEGVYVGKRAVINAGANIGAFSIINTGAIIEHGSIIGEFTHVAVGAVVCGGCEVGNDVFVGANATVVQGVKIGMNSIIGAGSVVLADVPENITVVGLWGTS